MMVTNKRFWLSIILALGFFTILLFVTIKYFFQASIYNDQFIAQEISRLDGIFKKINDECKIIGFKHTNDHVDFLTVKKFAGFMIGSMSLAHPEKWAGPYVQQQVVIDGKDFQIVRAKDGYFIIPGDGVKLANGQIINQTFKITPDVEMEKLLNDKNYFLSSGQRLGAHIEIAENPERKQNDELIADHVEKLRKIFEEINKNCRITGFRHEKDHIDFLNVKEFVGSIVGCMNLIKPKNWKGPYLNQNLTIDGKFYQIVFTKQGYYIVPDDGIELANGQIIGETLIFNEDSDLEALSKDSKMLATRSGRPLVAKIATIKEITRTLDKGTALEDESEML